MGLTIRKVYFTVTLWKIYLDPLRPNRWRKDCIITNGYQEGTGEGPNMGSPKMACNQESQR
jgi:hypothetical protein